MIENTSNTTQDTLLVHFRPVLTRDRGLEFYPGPDTEVANVEDSRDSAAIFLHWNKCLKRDDWRKTDDYVREEVDPVRGIYCLILCNGIGDRTHLKYFRVVL